MTGRFRVEIEDAAENDLFEIYRLRLSQRGPDGPDGAEALLDSLMQLIESLADFPERGPVPVELVEVRGSTWRQVSHPPYRIIYELGDGLVSIALIADARREFSSLFQRRLLASGR
jgi:plasmid stabilization system protein ParE